MNFPHRQAIAVVTASLIFSLACVLHAQSVAPIRLDKGTKLMLDLETPLNSSTTREGDSILLRTRNDIRVQDQVAITQGTPVKAKAVLVKPAFVNGKSKQAELHLKFEEILLPDGASLRLSTDVLKLDTEEIGHSTLQRVESVVRQSLPNAIVGGLLGGRTGATVGVLGGIGLGSIGVATRKKAPGADVDLPHGAIIQTSLTHSLEIPNPSILANSVPIPSKAPADATPSTSSTGGIQPPVVPPSGAPSTPVPSFDGAPQPTPATTDSRPADAPPTKTPGVFTLSVNVKLVQVDAVVHDRGGKSMTSLQKQDFHVFEDGQEQQVQHFSRDELPLAVALVIDRSGSVAPVMDRIQSAAFKALQQLKRGDQVALFSFARDVELLEPLTVDRQRVANRIGTIQAAGGTRIFDAVDEALRHLQHNADGRRRAVILISDNVEVDSRTMASTVIQDALKTEAVIYSVRIRDDGRIPLMPIPTLPPPGGSRGPMLDRAEQLAKETGGEVFDAKTSALDSALATAVARLKLRYTLGYAPAPNPSPGRYHAIEVRLADRFGTPGENYTVLSRQGYYE